MTTKKSLYSEWIQKHLQDYAIKVEKAQERHNMTTLSEWLDSKKNNKIAIYVDQDETLLSLNGGGDIPRKGDWAVQNAIFKEIFGQNLAIVPRPQAVEFLKRCNEIATTYILTAGLSVYQEQVLEAVGMLDLVEDVFGRDRLHELPQNVNGILIDNLPHNSGNSMAKLQAMGGGMYIKVPDWTGDNPHDNALMKVLPEIKKAFSPNAAA